MGWVGEGIGRGGDGVDRGRGSERPECHQRQRVCDG